MDLHTQCLLALLRNPPLPFRQKRTFPGTSLQRALFHSENSLSLYFSPRDFSHGRKTKHIHSGLSEKCWWEQLTSPGPGAHPEVNQLGPRKGAFLSQCSSSRVDPGQDRQGWEGARGYQAGHLRCLFHLCPCMWKISTISGVNITTLNLQIRKDSWRS